MTASAECRTGAHAYVRRLGEIFGIDEVPFVVTRSIDRTELALAEVRLDAPSGRLSDPLPREPTYAISLALRDQPDISYWEDGRQIALTTRRAGDCLIHDLQRRTSVLIDKPWHSLVFYLPKAALDALADETNAPRVEELRCEPGVSVPDETVRNLGLSLLPGVRAPDQISRLFLDHVSLGLAAHIGRTYGGMQGPSIPIQGGLATWQEKRSKEMLASDLTGSTPLHEIARACGLSVGHFSRAFRRSTGLAPHAWLLNMRVETAKTMLRRRDSSLSTIALDCGFSDQSHFTRVFTRRVGISPGAWRRYKST